MSIANRASSVTRRPSRLRRLVLGDTPWGRFSTRVMDRSGVIVHYVLVVYPPGTDDRERLLLWFVRTWPAAGAVSALAALMILGDIVPPVILLCSTLVVYCAGVGVGLRTTRRIRPRVRRVIATVTRDSADSDSDPRMVLIRRTVAALDELDRRAGEGELDPVHYEAGWAAVYRTLDETDASPTRRV